MKSNITRLMYNVLLDCVEARDDWTLSVEKIHLIEMNRLGFSESQYFDFYFRQRLGSDIHTLRRTWQRIQEEYPKLRGIDWIKRQRKGGRFNPDLILDESQLSLFKKEK